METPSDRQYTSEHEWVERVDDTLVRVGITDFAQDQLGDIVYVELPEVGRVIRKGEAFGVVESVKAVSDLFAPLSGEVAGRNAALEEEPEWVNASPYEEGWMIEVRASEPDEFADLLEAEAYRRVSEEPDS